MPGSFDGLGVDVGPVQPATRCESLQLGDHPAWPAREIQNVEAVQWTPISCRDFRDRVRDGHGHGAVGIRVEQAMNAVSKPRRRQRRFGIRAI